MREFLSGLTLGTIIALTTLLIVSVAIAQPNPGHSADQIGPGTFQGGGDYIFPSSSNIVMSDSGIYLRTDKFHGIKWSHNTNRFDGPTIFGYAGVSIEKRNETGNYSIANFTFEEVNISTNLRLPLYKKLYLGNSYLYGAMASGLDYVNAIGSFFVSDTFGADSPTLYVNASTHRVGIGTKYPSYKLDVVGDIKWGTKRGILSVDQGASIELGGTGKPYIDFSNDATTDYDMRIQLIGDNELSIQGGNVGIGTSTPQAKLDVDGKIKASGSIQFYGGWSEDCNETTEGTMRYYWACYGHSYWSVLQVCMRNGEDENHNPTFTWYTIQKYEWTGYYTCI